MSDDAPDKESKTEEPSDKRKSEAHEKGNIAYTREVGATLGFAGIVLLINSMLLFIYAGFKGLFSYTLSNVKPWSYGDLPFGSDIVPVLKPVATVLIAICTVGFVLPIIGHIIQKGVDPKYEAAEPKLDKMNPVEGIKRLFSFETVTTFIKNIIRTFGLMIVAYFIIRPYWEQLIYAAAMPFETAAQLIGLIVSKVLIYSILFLVAVAGFDYWLQWRRVHTQLMMTRQELKDEMKEMDGNPQIKGKMRQIQQSRAKRKIDKQVPQATVIVTNPTHFAVALRYDRGKTAIPIVVAKGVDFLAKRIKEVGAQHRVPVIENPPLARGLYRDVKEGQEIPKKFYQAVAKIIAAIFRIEQERKNQQEKARRSFFEAGTRHHL